MARDDERVDLSADLGSRDGEEKRVTSVMDEQLFEELEQWRAPRGMSRSEAVRTLVEEGVHGENWTEKVRDAQETLERAEVIAFTTAAVAQDGGVNVRLETRDGVEADYPIDLEGGYESLAVGLMVLLQTFSQHLDIEFDRMVTALSQMHQILEKTDSLDEYDLGGEGGER